MPGTNRALSILGLFSQDRPVITPEWLVRELAVSRASVYRDLGELAAAGLIERATGQADTPGRPTDTSGR